MKIYLFIYLCLCLGMTIFYMITEKINYEILWATLSVIAVLIILFKKLDK